MTTEIGSSSGIPEGVPEVAPEVAPEVVPEVATVVAPSVPGAASGKRLTCVDVFSGIGGIPLALAPFTLPVQYCEIDRYCQSVLLQRMTEGKLDKAPIHCDIRNLHVSAAVDPEMICGGFPCQDISSIGLQKGIVGGEKSSMFYEVMRLVDSKPSIEVVFLENVANILNCGIKEVVDELGARGFTLQWHMRTAASHGAPHVRCRWFLLACRGGGAARVSAAVTEGVRSPTADCEGRTLVIPTLSDGNSWRGTEPAVRVSFRPVARPVPDASYDDHWSSRCQTLGNAVVPPVVRMAFVELAQSARKWGQYIELLGDSGTPVGELKYPYPESAIVHGGMLYVVPRKKVVSPGHGVEIVSPAGGPVRPAGPSGTSDDPSTPAGMVRMENYPTPRRGITHASTLSDRSVRDLPTILVNCTTTAAYLKDLEYTPPPDRPLHTQLVPNVNYVEWMMGYPADWTKISHESTPIPMPPSRAAVARAAAAAKAATPAGGPEADADADAEAVEGEEDATSEDAAAAEGEEEAGEEKPKKAAAASKKAPKKPAAPKAAGGASRLHGMHMYMREHPGKDVPTVAKLWKELSDEQKAVYSLRAKEHMAAQQATLAESAVVDAPNPPPSLLEAAESVQTPVVTAC